jgi:cell fate regulator YaaT (PSP1 superfamily)
MGDKVIVSTAQGPEFATCTLSNHEVEDEAIVQPLCAVLRKATDSDLRTVEYNKKKESEAFDICEKKIAEHGLDMKLVNVAASFDGNKIIFYFTADGRVDFRELVRDLASIFRARIELRQIGVRDEAKMIGGLGICGRPFCCSEFLENFVPVSIKMAKTQNLSLNPTKISGTCGRLMCCLKYEQNAYEDAVKRMPKVESFVQTPDGPGNVKSIDLLRETVKVSLDSSPEPLKCYHNCEVCVLRNGKGSRDGIEIPERTERYVEEKEEEVFATPIFTTPFYMDANLEEAPTREKMGEETVDGKPRRRHRGGRRRNGKPAAEQQVKKDDKAPSSEQKSEKRAEKKPAEQKPAAKKPGKKQADPKRSEKKQGEKKARPAPQPKEKASPAQQPPKAEGGEKKPHRRPHHRGGRRKGGKGGEGSTPKAE